jgi:hypothetical protein
MIKTLQCVEQFLGLIIQASINPNTKFQVHIRLDHSIVVLLQYYCLVPSTLGANHKEQ